MIVIKFVYSLFGFYYEFINTQIGYVNILSAYEMSPYSVVHSLRSSDLPEQVEYG